MTKTRKRRLILLFGAIWIVISGACISTEPMIQNSADTNSEAGYEREDRR